jgi:hypothetical protein
VASNSASLAQRDYFEPQRCSYSILGPPVPPVTASAKFTGARRGGRGRGLLIRDVDDLHAAVLAAEGMLDILELGLAVADGH